MADSFFFYDLETSGFNPREARIMQFAGQRTDLDLQAVGEPVNMLIKQTEDVLPEPDAVLITGITPQHTLREGMSEATFLNLFTEQVATPGTIFAGYNTVRFDDEFMRYLHYRNFYDPYEWQWQDQRSRWDLLDVVRMMRALRPEGIVWPFNTKGEPSNRLELLTAVNKLDHTKAHDALNDVYATIELAALIRTKQPKLFDFLLELRDKKQIALLVHSGQPFVYTSGKYPSEFEKTTVVHTIAEHPNGQGVLVYDLRHNPESFAHMKVEELAEAWKYHKDEHELRLPVKTLKFNRCPAIAPISVFDKTSQERLKLNMLTIKKHLKLLETIPDWPQKLLSALEILDKQQQMHFLSTEHDVDAQLYDGFFDDHDRQAERVVRAAATPDDISTLTLDFHDPRLSALLPLYKARNFPESLTDEEYSTWERFRHNKLLGGGENSRLAKFGVRLKDIAQAGNLTTHQKYLLEELELWGQSLMPVESGE